MHPLNAFKCQDRTAGEFCLRCASTRRAAILDRGVRQADESFNKECIWCSEGPTPNRIRTVSGSSVDDDDDGLSQKTRLQELCMNHYPPVFHDWYVSPPERGHSGNGLLRGGGSSQGDSPGTSGAGAAGLKVKVAEEYTLPPPIDFSQFVFKEAPSTGFRFDFSYEKDFLESMKEEPSEGEATPQIVDPWESRIAQFEQMGHSREAILLALAIQLNAPDEKVRQFLDKLHHMTNMGFDLKKASMALSYHREDIQAAAETLIALDA